LPPDVAGSRGTPEAAIPGRKALEKRIAISE
jgi:hypothetical protein